MLSRRIDRNGAYRERRFGPIGCTVWHAVLLAGLALAMVKW